MADRTGKACRSIAIVMLMAWPSRNIYRATKAKVVSGRAVPGNLTDRQQIVLLVVRQGGIFTDQPEIAIGMGTDVNMDLGIELGFGIDMELDLEFGIDFN